MIQKAEVIRPAAAESDDDSHQYFCVNTTTSFFGEMKLVDLCKTSYGSCPLTDINWVIPQNMSRTKFDTHFSV